MASPSSHCNKRMISTETHVCRLLPNNQYITELDAYPLPRIDNMINVLPQYNIFTTFDLRSAYHQIKMVDSRQKFTAFEQWQIVKFTRIAFDVKTVLLPFNKKYCSLLEKNENVEHIYGLPHFRYSVTTSNKTSVYY